MTIKSSRKIILLGVLLILTLFISACSSAETSTPESSSAATPGSTAAVSTTPLPRPTLAPAAQQTPTSTPEADPRQELGDSSWGAVFEDGTQTWFQYDNENGSAEVRDNKLVLTSHKANGFDSWSMSYPPMTDFYLEVRFTTGPECAGKDRYGIFFRAPDPTHGYLYNAACDGSFQVREWNGEQFTQLVGWIVNEHIVPGPGIEHSLGVWAEGDHYVLYVNGFQVGEFTDDTYLEESTFGVAHAAMETMNFTVDVSEAKAWVLPR